GDECFVLRRPAERRPGTADRIDRGGGGLPHAAVALERDGGCALDRGRRWRTSSPPGAAAAELSRGSGWASCARRPARRARASRRPTTISCRSCTDAGPAVQAVRLTADLQRSRKRLVAAREEERRRLRR